MSRLLRTASNILRVRSPSPMRHSSTLQSPILENPSCIPRPRSAIISECCTDPEAAAKLKATIPPQARSLYRRELPADLVSFTSYTGREIFRESLDLGLVENYFSLVGNFTTQSEPAYCGLGSLSMVLNAMEVDPGRTWKGIWRWYSDEMLECCAPLDVIKEKGITLDQFVCLAKCHGLTAEPKRRDLTSYEDFLKDLHRTSTEPHCHMVISFSRQSLGQTGIGHFSPIGAYNPRRNLALVLDVARYKYPSYWAPIDKLWQSMEAIDEDTGFPRGYVMLTLASPRVTGCP